MHRELRLAFGLTDGGKYGFEEELLDIAYLVQAVLHLRSCLIEQPANDSVRGRSSQRVVKERYDVWVHLGHDKVVHIEQL